MLLCGQFIVMQWRRIDGVLLITCKQYISIDFSSSKLKKDTVGEEIALFEPSHMLDCVRAMRRKSYEMHQDKKNPVGKFTSRS